MPRPRSDRKAAPEVPADVLLAYQLERSGQSAEAERLYLDVLARNPRDACAPHQLGLIYRERGDLHRALEFMMRAVQADRASAQPLSNCAVILNELGRHREAIESCNRALVIDRRHVPALYNRGNALLALDRLDDALISYQRALELDPRHVDALFNLGNVLRELRRNQEALASYRKALAIRPDYADVHMNEALTLLRLGDFAAGWRKYEWRWRKPEIAANVWRAQQPLWLGEPSPAGRTLLLHAEQGFGDTLQFVRYAPLVARQGARVVVEVQPPLKPLVAATPEMGSVVGRGEPLPGFDLHCPLMSLPLAFGTELASIPATSPYLGVPPDRLAAWQARLQRKNRHLVALAWAGSRGYSHDHRRSLALERFAPLLALPGMHFVSVQRELGAGDAATLAAHPQIDHVGDALGDFADTGAVLSMADAVISVDTAVAHLAGALGRPLFVLLAHSPDFRWLLDRDDSPWYPSARLIRQPRPGDWDSVIGRLREAIAAHLSRVDPAP